MLQPGLSDSCRKQTNRACFFGRDLASQWRNLPTRLKATYVPHFLGLTRGLSLVHQFLVACRHRLAEKGWVKIVTVVMDLGQAVETESNLARMVNLYRLRQRQTKSNKVELKRKLKEAEANGGAAEVSGGATEMSGDSTPDAGTPTEQILKQLEELATTKESNDRKRRRQARAGVEAVMRVYFPDQESLEVTKQG